MDVVILMTDDRAHKRIFLHVLSQVNILLSLWLRCLARDRLKAYTGESIEGSAPPLSYARASPRHLKWTVPEVLQRRLPEGSHELSETTPLPY